MKFLVSAVVRLGAAMTFLLTLTVLSGCSGGSTSSGLYPAKSNGQWMYVDMSGEWVIDPQFKGADIFCEDRARVKYKGEEGDERTFVGPDGKLVTPDMFVAASYYSEGKVWAVREASYPECLDLEGKSLFGAPDADYVFPYHDGMAKFVVVSDGEVLQGFFNEEGNVAIAEDLRGMTFFSEGLCAATMVDGDQIGFIDKNGGWVINPQFDAVHEAHGFQDGRCPVSADGKTWGVIDPSGKYLVNPQFQDILPDGASYRVRMNGKYGWAGDDGRITINPQWSKTGFFYGHDLAPVKVGRKWGYINVEGDVEVNPQFDMAYSFIDGMAWVQVGDKWGVIDEEGKYVTNPQFDMVEYDLSEAVLHHNNPGYYRAGRDDSRLYVESDFFDIQDVLGRMSADAPEDNVLGETTFGELDDRYDSKSRSYTNRLTKIEVSPEVTLRFYSYGKSHSKYTDRSGWYETTKYRFKPELIPDGYSMRFRLSDRGEAKAGMVYKAMIESLAGYASVDPEMMDEAASERISWYDKNYDYEDITLMRKGDRYAAVVKQDEDNVWLDSWTPSQEEEED